MPHISVTYTKEHVQRALQLHYRTLYPVASRGKLIIGILLLSAAIFLFFNGIFSSDWTFIPYTMLLAGIVFIGYHLYAAQYSRMNVAGVPLINKTYTFSVEKDQLVVGQKQHALTTKMWADLSAFASNKHILLFYFGEQTFYIFPANLLSKKQVDVLKEIGKRYT